MGNGGDVLDHGDLQTSSLQRTNGSFTALAGALYINFYALQAMLHSSLGSHLSGGLGSKGSGLTGATETEAAGRSPGQCVALRIGQSDDGIIEAGLDMAAPRSMFFFSRRRRITAFFATCLAIFDFPPYFFLFAMVLAGPLRVRALVLVRWPRTGRPFLWRTPR